MRRAWPQHEFSPLVYRAPHRGLQLGSESSPWPLRAVGREATRHVQNEAKMTSDVPSRSENHERSHLGEAARSSGNLMRKLDLI